MSRTRIISLDPEDFSIPHIALVTVGLLALSTTLLLNGCAERSAVQAESREIPLTKGNGLNRGPCFSPDGELVAFTSQGEERPAVYVVPAVGGEARRVSLETSSEAVVGWTDDGDLIIHHFDESDYRKSEVCWVSLEGEVRKTQPAQEKSKLSDINSDGKTLWCTFTGDNYDAGIADAKGNMVILAKTDTWETDGCFGPGPDEVTLVRQSSYSSPEKEFVIWSSETMEYRTLPITPGKNLYPKWSPDRNYLAYVSDQSGNLDLWVYDQVAGKSLQITGTPEEELAPDWNPDGTWLAFARRVRTSHVFVADPETRERRQLTSGQATDVFPRVSPNGEWVTFIRRPKATAESPSRPILCYASVADGKIRTLDTSGLILVENRWAIDWAPDSHQLAFSADDGTGNVDIYRIALGGGTPVRVTIDPGMEAFASWSPSGETIAYMRLAGGETQIWAIPASGGRAKQLTFEGFNQSPVWAPNSDEVAYASVRTEEGDEVELWVTSYSNPSSAYQVLGKGKANIPEEWSAHGKEILVWKQMDEVWSVFAVSLDGTRLTKVGDEGEDEDKHFMNFTKEGRRYLPRLFPAGIHAFADGDDISNIYAIRVPELIESKLQADGDWN
jgi:TolB protein